MLEYYGVQDVTPQVKNPPKSSFVNNKTLQVTIYGFRNPQQNIA